MQKFQKMITDFCAGSDKLKSMDELSTAIVKFVYDSGIDIQKLVAELNKYELQIKGLGK